MTVQQRAKTTSKKSPIARKKTQGSPVKHSSSSRRDLQRNSNGIKSGKSISRKGRINNKNKDRSVAKKEMKQGGSTEEKKPREGEIWSKSKKKRMRALKARQKNGTGLILAPPAASNTHNSNDDAAATQERQQLAPSSSNSQPNTSKLQQHFKDRLSGSRFRILNEELYTTRSIDALQRFQANPNLFDEYHEGFRQQVAHWPVNPVAVLVKKIQDVLVVLPKTTKQQQRKMIVADFGCGDADLARQLLEFPVVDVHSFDLVARGPNSKLITACDIAKTPLDDASVDIGVFCLSLMGTNLADFIREAHRVLKHNGVLHIAEVRSRFEDLTQGGADDASSLQPFLNVLDKLGFKCTNMDRSNTMFVLLDLRKNGKSPNATLAYTAKPCIYKRR